MIKKLRLAVMGTTDFAVPSLKALMRAEHEIVAIYTQPPRPKGRGHHMQRSPMHEAAKCLKLPVFIPKTLRHKDAQAEFCGLNVDLAVVGAYGLLLPQEILDAPRLGCVNLHASALPRWRGAAPIQRALLAGDKETALSIFQMEVGLDTGPVLAMERIPIRATSTSASLQDELAALAAALIPDVVAGLDQGTLAPESQSEDGVTYAHKITKADGAVDFAESAVTLERRTRALHPWPGCWCRLDDIRLNILSGDVVDATGKPGEVIGEPLIVACGDRAFRVDRLQREGRKPMTAEEFQRGFSIPVGSRLQ